MSTKNLARTVIEGGRTAWSRWQRGHLNSQQRARQREMLDRLASGADADALSFSRRFGYRDFDDKLGPPRRWLASQIGRPWDVVRGELFRRFDSRTTAGRHIVFCHMLPWVEGDLPGGCRWQPFRIDRHGILRACASMRHHRRPSWAEPLPRSEPELETWLSGRRVGVRGPALFWFTPTDGGRYRQQRRLDDADAALWHALPEWFRKRHLANA